MAETLYIAVLTTGSRLEQLRNCLQSLVEMKRPDGLELLLTLVHNGSRHIDDVIQLTGSIQPTVLPIKILYQPELGIPNARNTALEFALEQNADYLAFIDDDGVADGEWCCEMHSLLSLPGVNAATGPQIPVFPEGSDDQFRNAAMFRERRLKEHTFTPWAATNNVAFSLDVVRTSGIRFNPDLHAGGEDKEFFLKFTANGGRIIWTNRAIVREGVEPDRQTLDWVSRRALRYGFNGHMVDRLVCGQPKAFALALIKCGLYLGRAGLSGLRSGGKPGHHRVDMLASLNHAKGYWTSLKTGGFAEEYA